MSAIVHEAAKVRMSITAPLTHLCPFKDEVDNGTVTITWDTRGATLELHQLRRYLDSMAEVTTTHEAITERILEELKASPFIEAVSVSTAWKTAGMDVTCSS